MSGSSPDDRTPELRSVHGGTLGPEDQLLRDQLAQRLFGDLAPPRCIGRFEVRELLGQGGMGQVFSAHDPQLHRSVALKVVRPLEPGAAATSRDRMAREAQAQAQLASPHVVTLFEVGPYRDGLYIAMELIEGPTLAQWLRLRPRSWSEIVDKFDQAGRGLAAAHRRGLVHRDFKPENVLLDREEERARVADFGLVGHDALTGALPALQGAAVTQAGLGTPGYMAPEQSSGVRVDARADQYSFCVALWEALLGERPGPDGTTADPGSIRSVPRRVVDIMRRGLATDPTARWPDMPGLLTALQQARAPRRARRWIAAGSLVLAAGGIALASTTEPCSARAPASALWNDDGRARLRELADDSPVPWAERGWPGLDTQLTQHATAWSEAYQRACTLAPRRSPALQASARHCLETAERDLEYLVQGLLAGDPTFEASAYELAVGMVAPASCNDPELLARWPAPTDERRAADRTAWQRLRDASLQLSAARSGGSTPFRARLDEALQRVNEAAEYAQREHVVPLQARTALVAGQVAVFDGRVVAAEEHLTRSAELAEETRDAVTRARALISLIFVLSREPERAGEAEQVARQAAALLEARDTPPSMRGKLLSNRGVARSRGNPSDNAGSLADLEQAVTIFETEFGDVHPDLIAALTNLGRSRARDQDNPGSLAALQRATTAASALWPQGHPLGARVEGMLGMAQLRAGDIDPATEHLRAALDAHVARLGPEHAETSAARYNLALALRRGEQHPAAIEQLEIGLASIRGRLDPNNSNLTPWLYALGRSQLANEDYDGAKRSLEEALELCEINGAPRTSFAGIRFALAKTIATSEPRRARVLAERSLAFYTSKPTATERRAAVQAFLQTL